MPSVGNVYVLMWLICSSTLPLCFIMSPLGCCSPPDSSVRLRMRVEALSQQCVCVCVRGRERELVQSIALQHQHCPQRGELRQETSVQTYAQCSTLHTRRHGGMHTHAHAIDCSCICDCACTHTHTHMRTRTLSRMQIFRDKAHTAVPTETQGALGCLKTPKHMSAPPSIPRWGSAF